MRKYNEDSTFTVAIPPAAENLQLPDPSLLNYYKDAQERRYWILGEVDGNLYEIVQQIVHCNAEDQGIEPSKRKPIRLIIASQGGSLEIAQTLVAVMEASETPIYCITIGLCASAASMIYLAGHKRYATRNAYFVFHQGGCENIDGSYQQIMAFIEKYQMDIEEMAVFYQEHTNFSPELINTKLTEGDWYITSEEALDNGIVHEIITNLNVLM